MKGFAKPPKESAGDLSIKEAAKIRLESQFQKWLGATASKGDIEDLLRAGKISHRDVGDRADNAAESPPEVVKGLTRLAGWIQTAYKIPCSKQSIKNWQKESPPFPASFGADYRYRWSDVAAWVEAHKVKQFAGNANHAELLAKLEPARIQDELERIEHERKMREVESGLWLKKTDVARACQGIGKIINGTLNSRLEIRLRVAALERFSQRTAAPALTPEQVAFAVDLFCELGRETSDTLKRELRSALTNIAPEAA